MCERRKEREREKKREAGVTKEKRKEEQERRRRRSRRRRGRKYRKCPTDERRARVIEGVSTLFRLPSISYLQLSLSLSRVRARLLVALRGAYARW